MLTANAALIEGATRRFLLYGSDPVTATRRAYGAAWGLLQQQSTMLSFVHIFTLMGLVFLLILPLTLVMKRPAHHVTPAAASE